MLSDVRLIATELLIYVLYVMRYNTTFHAYSSLSAFSAKLDTFKRLQAADMRAYDEVCQKETTTESWTAFRGNFPRLQCAAICSFASDMISGVYVITFVCCQSPHCVQLVLDRRRYPRARGCGRDADLKTLRAQSG